MSLHIFIRGNVYDFEDIETEYDSLLKLNNDCSVQTQVDIARQYWRYKDKDQRIAVLTNSDFFVREINNLIMLSRLSLANRLEVFQEFEVYKDLPFSSEDYSKITCYDLEIKEKCVLEDFGFVVKTFDKIIDFQNRFCDYIMWGLD